MLEYHRLMPYNYKSEALILIIENKGKKRGKFK